jgi:hypothetical protein
VEIVIGKLERYKSPGTDQIPPNLITAGCEILYSKIQRPICYICHKEELPQQWKKSIIVPIHKKGDKTDNNNHLVISLLLSAYKI